MISDAKVLHGTNWTATPGRNGNGRVLPLPKPSLLSRFKSRFTPENLIVAGREVKGFVVSPTIAAVLLGAMLGVMGWAYKSSTSEQRETRDAVIRMETMLNERTHNFEREQDKFDADLKDERRLNQLHRENQDRKQQQMVLALKAKGISIE